ncbi:MAG: hypothetical protein PHR07_03905 [Acidaminococcaceae bacterium]|nr:hypothetical protein [Acidaminococcaceae bacterium]
MGIFGAKTGTKEVFITAVVTRADGTKEDIGLISYVGNNPLKKALVKINNIKRKVF